MTTTIIDTKTTPTPGTETLPDGTRHLDLDTLFAGHLRTTTHTYDGLPANTVTMAIPAPAKLATSPHDGSQQRRDYFYVSGWDANNYGPTTYAAPLTRGPHMIVSKEGTLTTAPPEDDDTAYLIEDGDTLTFLGQSYRVHLLPNTEVVAEPLVTAA